MFYDVIIRAIKLKILKRLDGILMTFSSISKPKKSAIGKPNNPSSKETPKGNIVRLNKNHAVIEDEIHHWYLDGLDLWHSKFEGSVEWRLTPDGVRVRGGDIERTKGEPLTVRRIKDMWGDFIESASDEFTVPSELIYATIATESGGREDALRLEPGYVNDEETPHRVSAGLMQTLISTASHALNRPISREDILDPEVSIEAGTAYIASQFNQTGYDPPLVAAAYNAGGVHVQGGIENRWKLRQYPIGTGKHCDRFIKWYGDALYVKNEG